MLGIASCTVVMRDVTIEVYRRQHICLPIDYSNERRWGCSNEVGKGKCFEFHSNGEAVFDLPAEDEKPFLSLSVPAVRAF